MRQQQFIRISGEIDLVRNDGAWACPRIELETRPLPFIRPRNEACLDWIPVDVSELVAEIVRTSADKVEITSLPDGAWYLSPLGDGVASPRFQVTHHSSQRHLSWPQQEMGVIGHHSVSKHHEPERCPKAIENFQHHGTLVRRQQGHASLDIKSHEENTVQLLDTSKASHWARFYTGPPIVRGSCYLVAAHFRGRAFLSHHRHAWCGIRAKIKRKNPAV